MYLMPPRMGRMGDAISVDPTTLLLGLLALAGGMFLFGGKATPRLHERKKRRLLRKRAKLSRQISLLG